ncbi:MAG: hypothetical protein HY907_09355 [Deltaproteobacteria bacterium]|nr:hypothetical protein [Deltaproteobacteria bacterium]
MIPPVLSDAQLLPHGPAFVTEASGEPRVALWRTDDLGKTFRPLLDRRLLGEKLRFFGTWFLDERCGFVCGEDEDGDGALLATRDGGLSWEPVTAVAGEAVATPLTQVVFADERRGLVVAAGDALWRTVDAGRTWRPATSPGMSAHGIFFLDGTGRGWVLSQTLDEELRILRTQHFVTLDAGGTFAPLGDTLDGEPLRLDVAACAFWDERTGLLCGPDGLFLRTDDAGRSWTRVPSGAPSDFNFAVPLGRSTAYLLGCDGRMMRTDDAGRTFRAISTGVETELHAAAFADEARGFVVGEDGVALWTEDAGRTWNRSRMV